MPASSLPNSLQTAVVCVVAILMMTSVVAAGVIAAPTLGAESQPADTTFAPRAGQSAPPGPSGGPGPGTDEPTNESGSLLSGAGDELSPSAPNTTVVANLTLITGDTVTVLERNGTRYYQPEPGTKIRIIKTGSDTYLLPKGVNTSRFHPSLFHVETLLTQQETRQGEMVSVLVKLDEKRVDVSTNKKQARTVAQGLGLLNLNMLDTSNTIGGQVPKQNLAQVYAQLAKSQRVEMVSFDLYVKPNLDKARNITAANYAQQELNATGEGITVAVIDTGVDEDHPDLDNGTEVLEKDFTGEGTTEDLIGHGTHVAGIVAGDGDASNGRYRGIAPAAQIMDLRVFGEEGSARSSTIIDAMEFAIDHDADIISMSLGGPATTARSQDVFTPVVNEAVKKGTLVVVAAGNSGPQGGTIGSPGIAKNAITVGATDIDGDAVVSFSSRGPTPVGVFLKPDIVAPGTDITSAAATSAGFEEDYISLSGTSMATPAVSGVAALLMQKRSSMKPLEVKAHLATTADRLPGEGVYEQGSGQVNATAALLTNITIQPATIDYGVHYRNDTVTKQVTIVNRGDKPETLNLSIDPSGQTPTGNAELNTTQVTVPANGTVVVNLTVTTGTEGGVFGGHIVADDEYSVSYGYARAHQLNVSKQSLNGSAQNAEDPIILVPAETGFAGQPQFGSYDGSPVTFTVFSSDVTLLSPGFDEDTGEAVFVSRDVRITSNTSVTLDERDTVTVAFDDSALEASTGELTSLEAKFELVDPFTAGGETQYVGMSALAITDSQFRATPDDDNIVSIEKLLVPENQRQNSDDPLDVEDVYKLTHTQTGMDSAVTFSPTADDLTTISATYHRTSQDQSFVVAYVSFATAYPEPIESSYAYALGERRTQTIHVVPDDSRTQVIVQATNDDAVTFATAKTVRPLSPTTEADIALNEYPLFGQQLLWNVSDGTVSLVASFKAAGGVRPGLYTTQPTGNEFFIRIGDQTASRNDWPASSVGVSNVGIDAGEEIFLRTTSDVTGQPFPTQVSATYSATYRPEGDSAPPAIQTIDIQGLPANNTLPAGEITLRVAIADTNGVTVRARAGELTDTPFADGVGQAGNVTRIADGIYEITFNLSRKEGAIDLAIYAEDEAGNFARLVTSDALQLKQTGGPPALPGFDTPPTDPDGDGKFEDTNGNGELDIGDVQALFANRYSDTVENNVEAFDFNNNGEIDIGDIQSLFREIFG